jgi:TolB protein
MSLDPPGDIHVRNADGSNLVRLTTTPEFESWPRWSPDGGRLVFSRAIGDQVTIFTINADGTGEARLTPADVSDFMPDWGRSRSAGCDPGVRVAVTPSAAALGIDETRQFTATVRATSGRVIDHAAVAWSSSNPSVVRVTQSGLATAVGDGTAEVQAAFANAAGRAVVTVTSAAVLRNVILYATEEFGLSELAVVNPDGSGRRRLTTDGFGYFAPTISPDGRRIAFANPDGIFEMNADGNEVRQVFASAFPYGPVWSPDGSQIAFRDLVAGPFGAVGRIFVINVDGSGLRQVSPDVPDPNQVFYFDEGPSWSPDGSKIAFSRTGVLTVINVDGTGMTTLPTPVGVNFPSWSPDGTRIAYSAFTDSQDIFVSNADGSNVFRVTSALDQEDHPRWSPDSRRLVYCRVVDGFSQLFTVNGDGTGEAQLSATPTTNECTPSWSLLP